MAQTWDGKLPPDWIIKDENDPATWKAVVTRKGAPTPQDVKDEVFRLWMEFGRSWKRVSERTGIPQRTLTRWGEADNWEQRRSDMAAAIMPGVMVETAFALRMAAQHAGVRLQQIAFESAEYGVAVDAKEVVALTQIVDRGGASPNRQGGLLEEVAQRHRRDTSWRAKLSEHDRAEMSRRLALRIGLADEDTLDTENGEEEDEE